MMSLMGLTLTVGILVDDSIVVLENIFRHLQMGEGPREAAVNGRSEIGFAAIAITLVDVVVFAPIAFMSGITGQYFRQFGLVIVSATLFSLFVSFTLTPLLASRWYQARRTRRSQRRPADPQSVDPVRPSVGPRLRARRRRLPAACCSSRSGAGRAGLIVGAGRCCRSSAASCWSPTGILSTEFFPNADDGEFQVNLEMPPGTTLDVTDAATPEDRAAPDGLARGQPGVHLGRRQRRWLRHRRRPIRDACRSS